MLSKNRCWRCEDIIKTLTKCSRCSLAEYCSPKCLQDDQWRHKVACDNASLKFHCFACKKTGAEMKQCSNCLLAWFCSKECMKKGWGSHKASCMKESSNIARLSMILESEYKHSIRSVRVYYWGNMPASDLINLPMNEGEAFQGPLSLLMCGVADPRSVCLSLASLPDTYRGRQTFVLNDICPCALARTVLLLYLLSKGGARKTKAVTQIWYSLYLSDEDHAFLVSALQDLVKISHLEDITHGIMSVDADQFRTLKVIWITWLVLVNNNLHLHKQRLDVIYGNRGSIKFSMQQYLNGAPQEHKESMEEWFKNGMLLPTESAQNSRKENVTLTGHNFVLSGGNTGPFQYVVPPDALPFTCWDYKAARRAFPGIGSVQELYSKYITQVLKGAAKRLQDSNTVKIVINLGDCLNLPRDLPDGSKFDRIITSNLWDYIALPRLLGIAKLLLNPNNPSAVALTMTHNWVRHFPYIMKRYNVHIPTTCYVSSELVEVGAQGAGKTQVPEDDPQLTESMLCFMKDGGFQLPDEVKTMLPSTNSENTMYFDTTQGSRPYNDYCNLMEPFLRYLRASLLSSPKQPPKFLPSLKQLVEAQGFTLRDPRRLENRVTPFRLAVNCRKVTNIHGFELSLEWLLLG